MMGNMTLRFWAIRLTMWSLFHRNKARSATLEKMYETSKKKVILENRTMMTNDWLRKTPAQDPV